MAHRRRTNRVPGPNPGDWPFQAGGENDEDMDGAQAAAGFGQIDQVAQTLSGNLNVSLEAVNQMLDRNRQAAQLWKTELVTNLTEVLNVSQNLSTELDAGFMQFNSALGTNVAAALIWQKSIGDAFAKAAVQAIESVAAESLVRAIYSSALGFYLLAIQDYSGAAAAFESAAIFGAVGGAASLAGRAIAGSMGGEGGGGAGNSYGGGRGGVEEAPAYGSQLAPGASGSSVARSGVTVIFQGPVYGGQQGLNELANHISRGVEQGTISMKATVAQRVGGVGR